MLSLLTLPFGALRSALKCSACRRTLSACDSTPAPPKLSPASTCFSSKDGPSSCLRLGDGHCTGSLLPRVGVSSLMFSTKLDILLSRSFSPLPLAKAGLYSVVSDGDLIIVCPLSFNGVLIGKLVITSLFLPLLAPLEFLTLRFLLHPWVFFFEYSSIPLRIPSCTISPIINLIAGSSVICLLPIKSVLRDVDVSDNPWLSDSLEELSSSL